jgi:tetratricopeptide (TPR) repeat protein
VLTPPSLVRLAVRAGISGVVAVALLGTAAPARATPWAAPASATLQAAAPAPTAEPTSIEGALEAGDLTAAKALAKSAREAEPTAAAWQREGEVLEQAGDYREAAKAYRAAKKAAGDDAAAIAAAEEGLVRVKASGRGTVADEPASTHRDELDPRWEPPAPKEPAPTPEPQPELQPDGGRIVTKWYFWVTVGAIAASAAAVTAIAIRAARDDQPDALDSFTQAPASRGFGALRF